MWLMVVCRCPEEIYIAPSGYQIRLEKHPLTYESGLYSFSAGITKN